MNRIGVCRGLFVLYTLSLVSALALTGCGDSSSGTMVQVDEETKAQIGSRAASYKKRADAKKVAGKGKSAGSAKAKRKP